MPQQEMVGRTFRREMMSEVAWIARKATESLVERPREEKISQEGSFIKFLKKTEGERE